MNRDEIVNLLKNGMATVIFTKVDGSVRTMNCTLNSRYMPGIIPESAETNTKTKSNSSVAVWDTDKNAWRSFRVDSVQKIISL